MAANFSEDAKLARKLQEKFDKEASLKSDLDCTKSKNTSMHNLSDSDSDETVEPDPPDWEIATNKSDPHLKKTPPKRQPSKRASIHEMSDSDDDIPTNSKSVTAFHDLSDSDDDRACLFKSRDNSRIETKSNVKGSKGKCLSDMKKDMSEGRTSMSSPSKKHEEIAKKNKTSSSSISNVLNLKRKQTLVLNEDADDSPCSSSSKKTVCQYGSKCYRKNPSHLMEFHHPRDNSNASTSERTDSGSPPKKKFKNSFEIERKGPRLPIDVFKENQPVSFYLTKVAGIQEKYNDSHAMNVKDILSPSMGNLVESCQFNYMFEIPWLMEQYPEQFRTKPLMIVHGFKGPNEAGLQRDAVKYKNIKFCKAKLDMPYGTHHTKMMFLLYTEGMRVVIHTSNMIQQDWHKKTQGMWISPLFPKLAKPGTAIGDSPTRFKQDLLEYVSAYQAYQLKEWKDHICQHDMSSAKVFVVGSVPGRHLGEKKSLYGHMKLRKLLHTHGPNKELVQAWPVIGQFSSIGTLGPNKENWLCSEWLQSLATVRGTSSVPLMKTNLQLIFPTKDNVRTSLEGYPAGASIPYSINVAKKQPYLHTYFHVWKSEGRGRSRAMPHIKTYARPSTSGKEAAWFLVTSANLSKAAWGALEKSNSQLMIRSYEIGVLFLPSFFHGKSTFSLTSSTNCIEDDNTIPLPYELPPRPYQKGDRCWIWDIPHTELPDTNGNMWCPS